MQYEGNCKQLLMKSCVYKDLFFTLIPNREILFLCTQRVPKRSCLHYNANI